MKSKNRIRPFKKVCAAVLAAALLFGGFGTSGIGLQTAKADSFEVVYNTTYFNDIPFIADEAGVSIYINDPSAFDLYDAELETSVKGVYKEDNIITEVSYTDVSTALIWSDWSNIKSVSDTDGQAWTVQTGVSESNPITLTWTDAAQTQYGESLDVKLVITGLDISYVGRTAANANNGNYGVKSDGSPRVNLGFMKTASGVLCFQAYGVAAEGDTSALDTLGEFSFGVDVDFHLEFYNENGLEVNGTYLMYFQDLDIKDHYAYRLAQAKSGWTGSGVADVNDTSWWNMDNAYLESITFPKSVTKAYAIDEDSSLIRYSGRRVCGTYDTVSETAASVQAGVSAGDTMTWTGSRCGTDLFKSYSPGTGTISLTKTADNDQNIDDPDLSGALYAVHQESAEGPVAGYFVTKSNGTGYAASASSSESSGSVYYNGLYYTAGSSSAMEVNVGQYYVEELISPYGYTLDTSTHKIEVEGGENENVSSTDTVNYQQVTLTKESLTADGDEDKSDTTFYQYTVIISGLESGQEIQYTVNGGTTVSKTAGSGGYVALSGSEIYLQNGQSAVFEIPVGATYKITEYSNTKIASYTVEDANSKGKIAQASGSNTVSYRSLSTETETADSGEDVTVTFTNKAKASVTVTLKKTSIDLYGETDKNDTDAYTYTVKIDGLRRGDTYSYTDRNGDTHSYTAGTSPETITLSLLADETASFTLPEDATYKITEAANAKIPSYTVADANTESGGTIVSASGQETEAATALSTATETAEKGEEITVTFTNKTGSDLAAAGSLSFDANGGTYSDGTDLKTLKYDGDAYGYEESDYTARSTNYTKNEEASDAYAVPEREGYTFLGWASSADADTPYFTEDYSKASCLAEIEYMFPELVINTNLSLNACYSVFVPYTGLSDDFTWYYAGDYFKRGTGSSELTIYDDLMQSLGAVSGSSLTALLTSSSEDDYYCSVTGERDMLYYYTSYNDGEYILPAGTYYCAYETNSGEVTTASITLEQSGNENYFSTFSQTLYAVWEKIPTYLSLQKTGNNGQNIDPDLEGALYAVHQDDASGEIVGYFITDADGTGYAASTDSADADSTLKLSVSYDDTTFYATGETLLELDWGTYYVEELVAPEFYEIKDIGEVTVTMDNTEDNPAAAAYEDGDEEEVKYLKVSLTKVSRNADGSEDTSDTRTYGYKITIDNLESGDVITFTNRKGTEYTRTAGSSGKTSISLSLMHGDEIWFSIPVGATYTIYETSNKKIASYTVTDANADSGGTIVSASGANEGPYTALSTETETADDGEDVTVTFTNTTVEKTQVCLSKQSVTSQLAVNGISPVITNDMSEDGSYSNGFTLSVSAGSDSYTSYQWYYSTGGQYYDFSILEDNDRYSLSGTSTDTLTYDSGSGTYWGNPSVWLCCVMTDASGDMTVSETVYMTYYEGDSTEYYSLDKTSSTEIALEDADDTSSYEVYVEFAAAISDDYITYESDTNEDNSGSIEVTSRTGSTTISIQSGETITFSNVPVGAEYYFREESNDRIASYEIANDGSSGTVEGDASYSNETSGLALTTSTQTAESGEETTVTYINEVEKVQVLLSKQSVTSQLAVNGISPVITNDMSEDGSYSNGFTLSVSAESDSYTSYQWYYSTGGYYYDFSILEENDRYSLSGTSTDTLTYGSGSGTYWGNSSVWLCCVMTDASGNKTVSETAYMTYYEDDSTEYYSLDETSSIEMTLADEDDTSSYEVYVEFAAAISDEYITYESDTNEDNSGSITVTDGTGSTTVSIQSGETITFSNVPVGAEYYFREESNDKAASYEIANDGSSGTVEGNASAANKKSGRSLKTSTQTAENGEETTVTFINTVEKTQVCLSKQSVTEQITVNGISPVITNDMLGDESYSFTNGFTLSVNAGSDSESDSYTSYQWYYSTGGQYYDFSILEDNDRYSLSGTSTDTLTYGSGDGTCWGNSSVWLCCVMTDASGDMTVSEAVYITYCEGDSTEYYSLDETSSIEITLADEDDTSSYEVYVEFTAAISDEYITYESDTNEDNSGSITVTDGTGSTTVSIQSGETITFSNVPVGAEYYFREESNNKAASYEIVNDGSSGTVEGDASAANEESGLALTTSTQTAESGEETTVIYINKTVTDTALQILPNAGGTGIWLLLLMSFGAFCAAVLILCGRRTGIAPV